MISLRGESKQQLGFHDDDDDELLVEAKCSEFGVVCSSLLPSVSAPHKIKQASKASCHDVLLLHTGTVLYK